MSKVLEVLSSALVTLHDVADEVISADPFIGNSIAQIGTALANHELHQAGLPYTVTIAYKGQATVQVPTVQLPTVPPADVPAPSPAASAAAYPTG